MLLRVHCCLKKVQKIEIRNLRVLYKNVFKKSPLVV
jgi:hypothetical protein